MTLQPLTIRVTDEAHTKLSAEAEASGRSIADLIRSKIEPPLNIEAPTHPSQHESVHAVRGQEPA